MPVGKSRQLTDFEKNLKEEIYKRDNHIDNSVKYAIDTGQDYGVSKDTPQWRRDAINKYRDSHKVEIYDDNGKLVGTVGYEAHKAINKNKVFDYKGKNDEEKKVFSYLRQRHNRESRKREQREYYATAPYAVKSKAKKETESELFPSVRRPTISGETKNADVLNFRNRTDVKNKYNEIEREASKHRYSDNKVFTVPITQNKKINVKYGVMKKLDGIASRTDLSEYDRAKKMDEVIDQLGLSDDEKKNARSYAGIKKLELSSASNGEDSFLKEITQPIVKFLAGTRDAAESAARFFLKDGMKLDGSYTQAYNEAEKYYTENPDELGNDLFDNYKQGLSTPEGEYLRNAGVDKILEAYNDTTKASQFISDAGFRSAGQMAGDMALVQMAGVPNAMAAAKNIAGAAMSGTKAADTLSKVGNIAPKIKEVAGTGKVTKAANTIINGVNSVSVGKAVKFLNPLDNPTTALMGISAAQDKYSTLKRMGYDDETAKKSALFSGYVSTITEKMGYDGKPESFFLHKGNPVAGSATASKAVNAKKVLKDYLKANVSEGVEEIYNTVFDRAGDYFSKIGYVDENGEIKQRKVFGKEGIIDPGDIGENFLGGFVGGAVMGSTGVLSNIAQYDVKTVREYADDVRREVAHSNKVVTELAKEAGVENVNLPSEPNWEKASVDEINDYYSKAIDAHLALLNNEKVINHDAAEIQKAKNLVITPDGDNARQSVLAAANSGNSESSVISPSVTAAANVSERQMHDVKENLSEGGAAQSVEQVQNAVKKVTNTMINEFKNSNIKNIPNYQAAYDENLRLSTTKGATIDKDFIKTYASQYAEGLKRNNSKAYKELASVSDDVGSMLTDYLISNRIPQGIGGISALAQAGGELRSIVGKAAQTTLAMNGKIYNDTDRVSAISNEISNGNFAVVDGANDGNIALAKVGEYYEAYGADAVALAKAFGVSTHYIQKNGRKTLVAAVPSKYIGEYAAKSGYSGTQYSAGGNEYIYLTKDAERGNLSADAVRSDITAESDSDFIAEIEKNGMIELDERPSESKIETIAAQVERDNTIPVYLDGVDKLGEVLLVYANEEDVTRNMVKTDINSYYDGVMPERGIPLSENTDRHYDEDTIEISERPSEYDADSYALVVELDRTIPILLNGVDELGEVELNYSNEENVTRDMVKSDIDAYYSGTMPEHGVSLSNNYDTDIKFSVDRDGYSHVYNVEKADKGYLDYSNSDIETAIENIRNGNADKIPSEIEVARLNSQTVKKISDVVGFDISDYKCKIEKDTLLHIEKRHGLDGKQDQSLADPKDVARMGYVINNADNVSFLKDGNGDRVVSKKYNDRNNTPCPILMISKRIDGTYCVSQVVPDSKKKTVWVTSARIQKADVGSQVPNTVKGQQLTSETPLVSSSALDNINISQNNDIVKSSIRKNSGNDTENVKFSQDNSLDGGGIIRYNDDIDIPYRESRQLREYIMSENNRNGSELKSFDKKEIGDNFYVWKNNSKTDYDVVMQIEIDGNEDVIDLIRKGLDNGKTYGIDNGTKRLDEIVAGVRDRRRGNNSDNARNTAELSNGNDDRLYSRQSSDDDGIKFAREGGRNQQNTEVGNYGRDDILNGNDRRTLSESERERGSSVQEVTGDAKGNAGEEQSSASSRRIYARDVKEAGGVERRNDRGVEADFVKSEYYNDEMRRIVAENDERGVITHFILGNGRAIKYDTNFRGAARGDEVYIQADHGKYSPTQINHHEITHRNYSTDTVQALKNRIKSRLTNEQINDIAERLYRDYAQKRRSFDEIFEEFVCDVMADMNDYAEMFSAETREYWAAEEQDRKGYSPSTYTESIDAGGKSRAVISVISKNIDKISNENKFDIDSDKNISLYKTKSNYINDVFKKQGNIAENPIIGKVELTKSGAKSTIHHGFGEMKLAAVPAIKTVIEKGNIIDFLANYKSNGVDRYILAAKGAVDGKNVIIGAVVKAYPEQKHNAKFYLHEVKTIEANSFASTAPQLSVDTVNEFTSNSGASRTSVENNAIRVNEQTPVNNNNISQNDNIVNSNIRKNSENDTDIRFSVDENTDVNASDGEDMSYLSEPVKNIRNDINEVINRADLKKGGRVYDRAAAVRVRDSILDNISIGDIQGIDMRTKKDRAVMTVLVNRALNSAGVDAKRKSARDLTRYIAQNASVYDADSLCADGGVDYEGDRAVILNYIKHGVKISPDAKEAIISAVGENSARGYIAMMSNNSALGIDSVYDELSVALPGYFTSDALTEGEKMRRVIDVYTWLKDGKSMQDVKLIDVMTPDDARAFTELVQKQLELAFDTMGRDSAISREIAAERTKYEQRLNDIRERYEVKIADMRSSAKKKQSDGAKAKNISTEQTGNRFKNLAEAAKKYGAIAKGANAVRDIEMPKRIDDNRYVSRFARTMAEAGVTPDESLSEFERDILDGKMTYERITDEEAKKSATDKIMRRGFMQALDDWNEMIRSNQRIGKNEMALGQTLYNQCINAKDAQNAMKIAADLANIATQAGQTVQACMLIKQMSPDCQLYSLEQSVEKMKNEFENKRKFVSGEKRKIDLKINEELAQKLLNAKTEDERRAVMDEILQDIANQIPSTLKDKWDSWRYLSMLGNPRTHIRNIGGNAVFMLPVKVKNTVGWVLEKTISKDKRTKSLKSTKDSKNFAAADYAKMKDIIQGSSGKYEELSKINELRRIYKFKPLEWLRKANFAALEWEDGIFLKHHYVNAMAQFLTARGYTSEFMNSGTKDAASVLENARAYAMNEAQKATYRDANAIAETLSKWQRNMQNNDKLGVRVAGQAIEGIVPFKKTPLNIAKRGVEYSPIGLINGLYDAAANIKSGKVTAAQAIDKIASGLTGTGLVILGMGLSKLGLVKGDDDDDDKLARLDSATGEQSYSFKIGNHSYTIDWVAPASMPFFMGVSMQNAFDKTDKFTFEETLNAVLKIPAPLLNLSVLSSLNDLIRAGDYSSTPTEKMADYAWQATTSYVGQAFPTVMGQIARTVDKTKRNASFTDPDNGLPAGLDRFIARQTTKIPGLSKILEPKIDMWGREETYGDTWYGRLIGNTISPGYYKEINSTVLDDELRRLGNEYEGDGSVLPPKAPKYFTYEKQKYYMTPSEYARYSVIRGQKSFEAADELIRTDDYKNKSAAEKKKALEKCYDAAGDEAKNEILKGRGIDVAAKEAEKAAAKKKTKKKSSKKKKK